MFRKKVTLKILLLLIASDMLETAIHFFFKKGALSEAGLLPVTDLAGAVIFLKAIFLSPFLWAGLLTVVAVFVIWSTILSKIDLSVAVPIASFSYILVPLVSVCFLHERISLLRWVGILFILIGVMLVSLSSKERVVQNK